jgi:hypothetical protein
VIRLLAHPDIHRAATCLIGLSDLPGGDRLTLEQGNTRRETLWSPWIFAQEQTQIRVPTEAAALLRETALECLNARAAQFKSVLLTLSGGLDPRSSRPAFPGKGHLFRDSISSRMTPTATSSVTRPVSARCSACR